MALLVYQMMQHCNSTADSSNALLRRAVRDEVRSGRLSRVFRRDEQVYAARLAHLSSIFAVFDPVNGAGRMRDHERASLRRRRASESEISFVLRRFREFHRDRLGDRRSDARLNAVVAFMLEWDETSLQLLASERFRETFLAQQLRDIEAYVTSIDGSSVPFCKRAFKLVRVYLENRDDNAAESDDDDELSIVEEATRFSLMSLLHRSFVEHLRDVYRCVSRGENRRAVEASMSAWDFAVPFNLAALGIDSGAASMRYITGVACAGKSTLLDRFRSLGWRLVSRSDVGTFAGKASDPTQVAALHGALEWALGQHDNVLGDRGPIDNPLWRGIMSLGDGDDDDDNLPMRFLEFFDGWLNAPVIAYFRSQRVVVFVDTRPRQCQQRMLRRACDGDTHRGRIDVYPVLQTMAYYAVARIMSWPVVLVPYSDAAEFEPAAYDEQFERMREYFGEPGTQRPLPRGAYARTTARHRDDSSGGDDPFAWAKAVGIYK